MSAPPIPLTPLTSRAALTLIIGPSVVAIAKNGAIITAPLPRAACSPVVDPPVGVRDDKGRGHRDKAIRKGMTMLYRRLGIAVVALILAAAVFASPVSADQPAIGEGSCIGEVACEGLTGTVGDNSCNGDFACVNNSGDIGDNSCNRNNCTNNSGTIGNYSCNRFSGNCTG